jgi:hypothetical protein
MLEDILTQEIIITENSKNREKIRTYPHVQYMATFNLLAPEFYV